MFIQTLINNNLDHLSLKLLNFSDHILFVVCMTDCPSVRKVYTFFFLFQNRRKTLYPNLAQNIFGLKEFRFDYINEESRLLPSKRFRLVQITIPASRVCSQWGTIFSQEVVQKKIFLNVPPKNLYARKFIFSLRIIISQRVCKGHNMIKFVI